MSTPVLDRDDAARRVGAVLNDPARPLKERFRALFTLRNLGGEAAVACIARCFGDDSDLLKHELAYCLGQMGDARAVPALVAVLEDVGQNAMVRHEAGEALAAIGAQDACEVLRRHTGDPAREVAETCELALQRLAWLAAGGAGPDNAYRSVDPAPPASPAPAPLLRAALLDDSRPLFERYQAMFTLRDLATPEAIDALCDGLSCGSALFRHEVAFVLGQVQSARALPALRRCLEDAAEHEMVRHEAAEALGALGGAEAERALARFLRDPQRVVRESCEVALDVSDYNASPEFQYADTLCQLAA